MTAPTFPIEELRALADAACDGTLGAAAAARLEELLRGSPEAQRFYLAHVRLDGCLRWEFGYQVQDQTFPPDIASLPQTPTPDAEPTIPPIILDLSPTSRYPLSTIHYPLSTNFVGGPVFSYMVASVILGMMLLGAWAYKITHYNQIAEAPAPTVPSSGRPELVFVGRISGMADCQWSDPQTEAYAGASVPLGRKYALASGLMEITYTTGAKVILQGPCTYEVESRAGGYLALGKLTAKVEKERSEVRGQRSDHYPLSTIHYPLFSVRTPTAIVTDLGTEFGVEVSEEGNTTSHVFRGSVRVQVVGGTGLASGTPRQEMVLRENESARVEKGGGKPLITRRAAADGSQFALAMPPLKSVRDSEAYAKLVLSLNPVVYYRMERPKKGTGPIGRQGGTAGLPSSDDSNGRTLLDKPAVPPSCRVFDSAPGGHHGELRLGNEFGSPYVPGRFGDALLLRGPAVCDRVVVPDYPKTTDDRLTVSAWVMATGRPGWAAIVGNWDKYREGHSKTGQVHLALHRNNGDLCARVTQRDGQWVLVREGDSQQLPLYVWQHVALVADGSTLHLYRNGEEAASSPYTGILPQPPVAGLGIGCRLNNAAGTDAALDVPDYNLWQGRIDELAIFNQALSPETIRQLFHGKPSPKRQAEATTKTKKGGQPMNGP